jgi:hypothetical protein
MSIEDIGQLEPDPLETEPRSCCEDLEILIALRAAELVLQWELDDPRDSWRHTGEAPPKTSTAPKAGPRSYSTPESVVQAFWYVASLNDADYLKRWLSQHPRDVTAPQKLWEAKHARS